MPPRKQHRKSRAAARGSSDSSDNRGVLSGIISGIKNGVSDISDKVESVLNNFIEALAVMLVTSCVIPVLVLVFFFWLAKSMLGTVPRE